MSEIENFVNLYISESSTGTIDDIITKYLQLKKLSNSNYEKIEDHVLRLIKGKDNLIFSPSTGEFYLKKIESPHPILKKIGSFGVKLTGRISNLHNEVHLENLVKKEDIISGFDDYKINNILIQETISHILMEKDGIYISIKIERKSFDIDVNYDESSDFGNNSIYLEYLRDLNEYQVVKKGYLPLDASAYSVFLKLSQILLKNQTELKIKLFFVDHFN